MQSACQSPALVKLSEKIVIAFNDLGEDLSPDQKEELEDLATLHRQEKALFRHTIKRLEAENHKLALEKASLGEKGEEHKYMADMYKGFFYRTLDEVSDLKKRVGTGLGLRPLAVSAPVEDSNDGWSDVEELPEGVPACDTRSMIKELGAVMKAAPKPMTCAALFKPVVTPLPMARNTSQELGARIASLRRRFEPADSDFNQD